MKKRAHKVLGVELKEAVNITLAVADPVGKVNRDELTWAGLSGGQQGKVHGHAKCRLGQSSFNGD